MMASMGYDVARVEGHDREERPHPGLGRPDRVAGGAPAEQAGAAFLEGPER
jgi:hypothetical protein